MAATQERSLSQFPTAASILLTTLLFGSVVDTKSTSGYDSVKILVSDLADAILGDFTYTQDLNTDVKTIFGAINSIMVLSGTATPNNQDGANGQLYVKYASADYSVVALYVKLNNAWREISTGGGGGASVDMGTTVPSDASGSNGDMYVQYDGTSYAVIDLFVKINDAWRKSPYSRVVALTQSEYSQITPDPTALYIITDAQSSYQTKTDNGLDTDATTIVGGINELHDSIGADVYSTNTSYTAGMYCIRNNTLYRCKSPTSGAWDSTKWEEKTITSLLESKANSSDNIQEYNNLTSSHLNDDMLYSRNGRLVTIACQTTLKTAVNANDTLVLYTIGTAKNKPLGIKPSTAFISGDKVGMIRIDDSSGDVTLYNQSGSNIAISSVLNFTITFYAQG